MEDGYWIRKAQPKDIGKVARMWRSLVEFEASLSPRFAVKPEADRLWREEFTRDRNAGRAEVFVAETDEGEPAGFLHVRAVPGAPFHEEDRLGFVDAVWIEPGHRRHGVARRLVNTALVWCRERKLTVLEAGVVVANRDAVKAWETIGFEMTSAVMTFRVDEGPALIRETLLEPAEADAATPREERASHIAAFARLPEAGWVLAMGPHVAAASAGGKRRVVEIVPSPASAARGHRIVALPNALPFRGSSFSSVVARRLLEGSGEPAAVTRELARVLEPGGHVALDGVLGDDDASRARAHDEMERHRTPGHVHFHMADAIRQAIREGGLTLEAEESVYEPRELEEWLREGGVGGVEAERVRDVAEKAALQPERDPLGIQMRRVGSSLRFDERRIYILARKA